VVPVASACWYDLEIHHIQRAERNEPVPRPVISAPRILHGEALAHDVKATKLARVLGPADCEHLDRAVEIGDSRAFHYRRL
jgi:hypothetical protein